MGSVVWGGGDGGNKDRPDPPGRSVVLFVVVMALVWLGLVWAFMG